MFLITTSLFALLVWASSKIEDEDKDEKIDETSVIVGMVIFAIFAALFNSSLWQVFLDNQFDFFVIFKVSFLIFILIFLFATIGVMMLGKDDYF